MKTLFLLIVLGVGAWYFMTKAKDNAAVKQIEQAPQKYTDALQNDVNRAKAVEAAANKLVKDGEKDVQKAVDAAQ
jgi:hypothetical protein